MRTPSIPRGPAGFAAFDLILKRTIPFTASDGRAFACVPAPGASRALAVRSRAFRQWFFAQAYAEFGAIPTSHAFSAIRYHLEAQATRDPARSGIRVPRRVDSRGDHPLPDRILLDLANPENQFVDISAAGWHVDSREDVHFETSLPTGALPAASLSVPQSASSHPDPHSAAPLETLRTALNLGPPNGPDWLRCLAWILNALRPHGPFPVLILRGPAGCGKSFAARILRSFIDPSPAPLLSAPSSVRQLFTLARHNWVLAFDHVSALSPQLSDALCRLSSGIGIACPEETDREPVQLWLKRPILLTVTGDFTPSPALAARALTVTLPDLTAETRRSEQHLLHLLRQHDARILGALCDAISAILRGPLPEEPHVTRHADALAWAVAAAPALPCTPEEMRAAFDRQPPSDPVLDAVRALLRPNPQWTGTATDLAPLLQLTQNPKVLSGQLQKHALALADAGIQIELHRHHGGTRLIQLRASPDLAQLSQPAEATHLASAPEIEPDAAPCVTRPPVIEACPPLAPPPNPSPPPRNLGPPQTRPCTWTLLKSELSSPETELEI